MREDERRAGAGRRAYAKPEMKLEKIHRFFFVTCQTAWPFCYSQNMTAPLMLNCR